MAMDRRRQGPPVTQSDEDTEMLGAMDDARQSPILPGEHAASLIPHFEEAREIMDDKLALLGSPLWPDLAPPSILLRGAP